MPHDNLERQLNDASTGAGSTQTETVLNDIYNRIPPEIPEETLRHNRETIMNEQVKNVVSGFEAFMGVPIMDIVDKFQEKDNQTIELFKDIRDLLKDIREALGYMPGSKKYKDTKKEFEELAEKQAKKEQKEAEAINQALDDFNVLDSESDEPKDNNDD